MKKIKFGIIGLGYMGFHHLKLLNSMIKNNFINASIELICDTNLNRIKEISKKYNIKNKTCNPKIFFEYNTCDAIIIASPNCSHEEHIKKTINNGSSVYCEKPLCLNSNESFELVSKVKEKNINNQVGLVLRHSPLCTYIKYLLEFQNFGKPKIVNYRHDACFPEQGFLYQTNYRSNKAITGGGILKEASVHDIDLLLYLFGDFTPFKTEILYDQNGIDWEVSSEFCCDNKTKIYFNSFWHKINKRGTSRRIEIFCENGIILADDFMFTGSLKYQISGKKPVYLNSNDVYEKYCLKNNIPAEFKQYLQWYSSLADYSFYKNIIENKPCYPSFEIGAIADRKIENIYN